MAFQSRGVVPLVATGRGTTMTDGDGDGAWLALLNSIMRDVNEFAGSGDYRLEGALVSLSSEARRAAEIVRAVQPQRRAKRLQE